MARNQEKANLMMNRWTRMKEDMARGKGAEDTARRPFLASECKDLSEAEKWRREIVRDITRKIAEIQNAGLGEARIRDLNDEINKLVRTKYHWERQIKALGGPDYVAIGARAVDDGAEGAEVPGGGGYKYYGAARSLPGVKELFEARVTEPPRRTRAEIMKNITPDYYGYRDEEDGVILAAEARREREWIAEELQAAPMAAGQKRPRGSEDVSAGAPEGDEDMEWDGAASAAAPVFHAHVPLPTQADIDAMLVEKRKQLLIAKYASPELAAEQSGAARGADTATARNPSGLRMRDAGE